MKIILKTQAFSSEQCTLFSFNEQKEEAKKNKIQWLSVFYWPKADKETVLTAFRTAFKKNLALF